MSEEILDSTNGKKQPLTVLKTLLWAGAISVILVSVVMTVFWMALLPYQIANHILTRYVLVVIWLIPSIVAMYCVSVYGNRKRHFIKIIATGILSLEVTIVCMCMASILREIIDPYFVVSFSAKGFTDPWYLNLVVPVLAVIFWKTAGKLPYFRKQMEP